MPVAVAIKYLNLEISSCGLMLSVSHSCHSNPQFMSVPRCGSNTVDLALKFNTTTKEQDAITTLNDAVKDGKLGEFTVGAIKGKRPDVKPTNRGPTTPTDSSSGGRSSQRFL